MFFEYCSAYANTSLVICYPIANEVMNTYAWELYRGDKNRVVEDIRTSFHYTIIATGEFYLIHQTLSYHSLHSSSLGPLEIFCGFFFFGCSVLGSLGFGEDDGRGVGEPLNETEYVSPYTVQDLDLFG